MNNYHNWRKTIIGTICCCNYNTNFQILNYRPIIENSIIGRLSLIIGRWYYRSIIQYFAHRPMITLIGRLFLMITLIGRLFLMISIIFVIFMEKSVLKWRDFRDILYFLRIYMKSAIIAHKGHKILKGIGHSFDSKLTLHKLKCSCQRSFVSFVCNATDLLPKSLRIV